MNSGQIPPRPSRFSRGARNLIILTTTALLIALITTAISLSIYHASGDIYLDRSRPGFISKKDQQKGTIEQKENQNFSSEGAVNQQLLEDYLKAFDEKKKDIVSDQEVFSASALSDLVLDIVDPLTEGK